ncbi:MAG: metallophosphoesterase [Candidatus Odinarchaeota archaeon]
MLALILSDVHGNHGSVEKIAERVTLAGVKFQLIILAGDITHFGDVKAAANIFKILERTGSDRIFFIPGNCDSRELENFTDDGIVSNIHMRVLKYLDYWFLGLGGSSPTPFKTLFELSEDEINLILKNLSLKTPDSSKLITVTHDPPYGTAVDFNKRGLHVGSRKIREFILNREPLLHISGHIHEAMGQAFLGRTMLVNPGSASLGYYTIIDIKDGRVNVEFNNAFK